MPTLPRTSGHTPVADSPASPTGLAARLLLERLLDRAAPEELVEDVRDAFPQLESSGDPDLADKLELRAALLELADTTARILTSREFFTRTLPNTLNCVIEQQKNEITAQELRFVVLNAYATALEESASWRLLAPIRWLRRRLRPRGFTAAHLLPWLGLEPVADAPPGTWEAVDENPHFIVSCHLPAGWVRVRLKMHSPVRSRIEFYAERNGTLADLVGQFTVGMGENDEEFFLYLPADTRALRIDPLEGEGIFRLDRLDIMPRPSPLTVFDALRRKLRLLRAYRNTGPVLRSGLKMLLTGRWGLVAQKWWLGLDDPRCTRHGHYEPGPAYDKWVEKHRLTDDDRAQQWDWAEALANPPTISLIMPTYNTPEKFLRLAIESVRRQTYPYWELCIADDGSTQRQVRPILEEFAALDPRIKIAPGGKHGGISAASNAALAMATGDYVGLFDHDDEIAEHALYRMAKEIIADPGVDMLYSDEDKIHADGRRIVPFFKPRWSPEFFLGCMYTCHLGVYRSAMVREIGGFRSDFDGAQDYDLVLRLIERTDRIRHVPDILYHWRLLPNSTAARVAAKPQAHAAGMRALQEHLERTGRAGNAQLGPSAGLNHVRFEIVGRPKVSIIIPSLCRPDAAGDSLVERCVASIVRETRYKAFEVLVLDRLTMPVSIEKALTGFGVRRVTYDQPFNWSRVNNLGATHATGEHLLFLNDDTEVITAEWLGAMIEFSQQRAVGAVGAKLVFPDGGLQHAGVTVLDGTPGHPYYGYPSNHPGYFGRSLLAHNCAAVTGACLMTRAEVFREVGGFDEGFPLNYNDVDYCMRVRHKGYRVVYTPHARLHHQEAVSKEGVSSTELDAFQARWGSDYVDPYYNPNLTHETFDYRIRED
jgi:GT2 family glycosyltransferase